MKKSLPATLVLLFVSVLVSCGKESSSVASLSSASSLPSSVYVSSSEVPALNIEKKKTDLYIMGPTVKDTIDLSFINGVNDIPFVDMDTVAKYIKMIQDGTQEEYTMTNEDGVFTILGRHSSSAVIDFKKDTVTYNDFTDFFTSSYSETSTDALSNKGFDSDGKPAYFEREASASSEVKGTPSVSFDLKKRDIPMYYQDGMGYLALQTFSDMFVSPRPIYMAYNGLAVFLLSGSVEDANLKDLYYQAPKGIRSQALTEFNYKEFVLALDLLYGLKKEKNITDFDSYLTQTGIKARMLSSDPLESDKALCTLAYSYLGDMHTKYFDNSPYAGKDDVLSLKDFYSYDYKDFYDRWVKIKAIRAKYYTETVPSYEKVGDTAFISFDNFIGEGTYKYYKTAPVINADDTLGRVIFAHSQIVAAGDAIKNVVLDLSCNTGGAADAAIFVASWFLGASCLNIGNTVTGTMGNSVYRADVNLDRKFDDNDTLGTRHLYCLTSKTSFSCGNLVPNLFKNTDKVSLIGQTSGGGSCVVAPISLADGTIFRISGESHIYKTKNGTPYDVDRGADPDFPISDLNFLYSNGRQDLVSYIDSIH
jgi:hypothetical protein